MPGISKDQAAQNSPFSIADLDTMIAGGRLSTETAADGTVLVDPVAVARLGDLKEAERRNDGLTREIAALRLALARPQDRVVPWLALAVAVFGAGIAIVQIKNAIDFYRTNNDYKMQSDYSDFFRAVIDAPPDKMQSYAALYDAKFSSIYDLYQHGGISRESWRAIATQACPKFRKEGFALGGVKLPAVEKICDQTKTP